MTLRALPTLTLAVLATAACRGPTERSTTNAAAASALVGHWSGPCVRLYPQPQDGGFVDTTTQQSQAVFTDTAVTVTANVFRELNCASQSYVMNVASDYTAGAADAAGLKPVDYTLRSIEITYLDPVDLADINDAEFCGFKDWQLGVAKDVSGQKCFDDDPPLPRAGDKLYDVALVDGGKLYFGLASEATGIKPSDHDGSTAAKRPTSVDRNQYLTPVQVP